MIRLLNFLVSVFMFGGVVLIDEASSARKRRPSPSPRRQLTRWLGIKVMLLEATWIYMVVSLILLLQFSSGSELVFVSMIGASGVIVIPIDAFNRSRRRRFDVRDIEDIEYLFKNRPEDEVLAALAALAAESVNDSDAREAIAQLALRDDALGSLIRYKISVENDSRLRS